MSKSNSNPTPMLTKLRRFIMGKWQARKTVNAIDFVIPKDDDNLILIPVPVQCKTDLAFKHMLQNKEFAALIDKIKYEPPPAP